MVVSREDLERAIAEVVHEVRDPRAGIFGPGSISWLVDRELVSFVAGGRAALLQLAHPFVAHAVDQHSAARHDAIGRFQRTFQHVFAMSFGDLDHAIASARRVHAIHARIYGSCGDGERYEANDPDALLWVHATLVDSAVMAFEQMVRPLSEGERDDYLAESRRFASLFAIDTARFPGSWSAFQAYNQRMWSTLRVSAPAREIATHLMRSPWPGLQPLADHYQLVTAGLLPGEIREQYGLHWGRREALQHRLTIGAIGAVYRRLPRQLRRVPAYSHALSRLRGEGPDPLAARIERWLASTTPETR